MGRLAVLLMAALLVAAVTASAALLLPACGVRLPLFGVLSVCDAPEAAVTRRDLAAERAMTADLAADVTRLERDLALLQCVAEPPPPPPPVIPETPSGLAPEAFEEDDISVMEGCWELQSDYQVRDVDTGDIVQFNHWRICFDENGNGREEMRATDGTLCEGVLTGAIGDGRLTMREPGKLQCDAGWFIFRRDITCALDAAGAAQCETFQPEINGRSSATLRRAGREPQ